MLLATDAELVAWVRCPVSRANEWGETISVGCGSGDSHLVVACWAVGVTCVGVGIWRGGQERKMVRKKSGQIDPAVSTLMY